MYQFSVRAVNVIGSSELSDPISLRAAEVPAAPEPPTKLSSTRTSITITWQEPPYDGGNPVSSYKVYMDDGLGGDLSFVTSISATDPLEHTADTL